MKSEFPDIDKFERVVFKKKNPLDLLLSFSIRLMQARHVGLLLGTDKTYLKFMPPVKWDRGVMHKFNGRGLSGVILKYFGNFIVSYKGLSPVKLYQSGKSGTKEETEGIISFVLRTHKEFYEQGIKILVIDIEEDDKLNESGAAVISFDGKTFKTLPDLKVNNSIVKQFKAQNFLSAYIPDYGAIVFNTVNKALLQKEEKVFIHEKEFKERLNLLISAIEMVSLAHIGSARGRQAARVIWRKEKRLRKTALKLKNKAAELHAQKEYLKAVGAVTENQLNMEAVNVEDGVYAFMDMVGSASLRKYLKPRDYLFVLNMFHQITANNASKFSCRLDNFMGDCVYLQSVSPFDTDTNDADNALMGVDERVMLIFMTLASTFKEISDLQAGKHDMDKKGRVKNMVREIETRLSFRAGVETGSAMVGPLGSRKRKIVTAIGKAVNDASRLESSGRPGQIHTSQIVMNLLKDAWITAEKKKIWQIMQRARDVEIKPGGCDSLNFLDYFKKNFNLGEDIIFRDNNTSYKEFSQPVTYLIQCIPYGDGLKI